MRFTLLILSSLFCLSSFGQFEIRVNGEGEDVSGSIVDVTVGQDEYSLTKLWVLNTTDSTISTVITRVRESVPDNWYSMEALKWPPLCYSTSQHPDVWTTPLAVAADITSNTAQGNTVSLVQSPIDEVVLAELMSDVHTSADAQGMALYKFYLSDTLGNHFDSVSVRYNVSLASINETQSIDLTVAPNPASNNLTVDFDGANSAELKMVDVLGNIVLEKTITGKETIDVSSFRNGIYFVAVSSEGRKPVVRKVIVRH